MKTLTINLRANEASRTPDRPCFYDANTSVDGVTYAARARYGVCNEIARQLVAAGIPDQPVTAIQQPQGWQINYRSLHHMALRTIEEGATTLIRGRTWRDPSDRMAAGGWGKVILSQEPVSASTYRPAEHPRQNGLTPPNHV